MTSARTLLRSMSGGEISPEMNGQILDAKYISGLATCKNFICRPQGPITNRPGFKYVAEVKDSTKATRIVSFTYSTDQTMIIEISPGFIRFHTDGATLLNGGSPYEITNPYAEADIFGINFVQSSDVMTLVHPNYAVRELRRLSATSWTLTTVSFGARIATPTGLTVVAAGHSVDKYDYEYVVTAFHADGIGESAPTAGVSDMGNLLETGGTVGISWSAVTGASKYRVYKLQGGIYGYIGETDGLSITDDNISPDLGISPPTYETVFDTTDAYPGAVSYFEQRRSFAGTNNEPQKFWMTKSGTESDMSYSLPILDSDRISFRIAAREANRIRHMVPMQDLLLLTSSVEWVVTSVNSDAVTPNTITVKPQSFVGASEVQPLVVNNSVVFCAARGGHVREMGYIDSARGYVTGDLCLRSAHLFDGFDIVQTAYSKAPDPIVWCVSSNGQLLGLTYVPEQQIGSWHKHETDGEIESCAVVAEGNEDYLYVVVKRNIDGSDVRYIERMAQRLFVSLEESFFVDAGGTFDGRNTTAETFTISGGSSWASDETLTLTASTAQFSHPATTDVGDAIEVSDSDGNKYRLSIESLTSTTVATVRTDITIPAELQSTATANWSFARDTITDLDWLEGETVSILADGAVHPQRVVSSGEISLDRPASLVHVGLPYQSDAKTLPAVFQTGDGGYASGRNKKVNKVWVEAYKSSGIFAGQSENELIEAKQRSDEPYGVAPGVKTESVEVVLDTGWRDGGQVFIRQSDPLPLTIVSLTLEVEIGG